MRLQQQQHSQDMITSYTAAYRDRNGFLRPGWNSVDLMSAAAPSPINDSGHKGEGLMSYYAESCRNPTPTSDTTASGTSNGRGSQVSSLWCPRLFSPIQRSPISTAERQETDASRVRVPVQEEAEYDGGLEEESPSQQQSAPGGHEEGQQEESEQSLCLGRAVVYQQAR